MTKHQMSAKVFCGRFINKGERTSLSLLVHVVIECPLGIISFYFYKRCFLSKLSKKFHMSYEVAVSIFYVIEIEIWAGFGPVGSTEKIIYEPLLRAVFLCFHGQKCFF